MQGGQSRSSGTAPCLPPCSPGLCYPRHPRSDPPARGRRRPVAAARPRNPKLPGTRRPSPHPNPQLLRGRRRLVAVLPPRNPKLPGTRRPSPDPHHQLLRGWRRLVSTLPRLRNQHPLGRDVPAPIPTLNDFGGGDVSSPHSHALATQNFLGRDVPAPIQTLHYLGGGDVSSPHPPTPASSTQCPPRPVFAAQVAVGFRMVGDAHFLGVE